MHNGNIPVRSVMANVSGPQQWPHQFAALLAGDAAVQFKRLREEYKKAQNRHNARKNEKNQSSMAAALKAGFDFLTVKGLYPNLTIGDNAALIGVASATNILSVHANQKQTQHCCHICPV